MLLLTQIKMGVDFYNCAECTEIYADCGDYTTCDVCGRGFCSACEDVTTEFELECEGVGDCVESMGWVDPDVVREEDVDGVCTCCDVVKNFRKNQIHHETYRVCEKCLTVKDPYDVGDTHIISYLLKLTQKSRNEVVEDIKKEWKKQRVD